MKKRKSRSKLVKELDAVFSQRIRHKYADPITGLVQCYTCSIWKKIKEMQNGHFITRSCLLLRRDQKNCRPQCIGCNVYKSGNYIEYTRRMIEEVGIEEVDRLRDLKNTIKKRTLDEIEEMISFYKSDLINYQTGSLKL